MRLISFDTKGWRARLDQDFTEDNVARVADAVGAYWSDQGCGKVVYIGFDTRQSASVFAHRAAQILASWGFVAKLSDRPCPLPALSFNVAADKDACGGLMISASGSPSEYEGVCLRDENGCVYSQETYGQIEDLIPTQVPEQAGEVYICDFNTPYLEDIRSRVDEESIRKANLRIVVDPMYGTARDILANLLGSLGVDVIEIHGDDVDDFCGIHPRPVEPWIDECERAAVNLKCQAGLILDGDADRLGVVDSTGHFVNPHRLSALLASHLVENRGQKGRVVAPLSSSMYIRRQAWRLGCPLTHTPIGFLWASLEMHKGDCLLATDTAGGIAYPCHLHERDGIMAAVLLVEMMACEHMNMDQLVDQLEQQVGHMDYGSKEILLDVAQVQMIKNYLPGVNPQTLAGATPSQVSHGDGLRLQFDDGSWVMIRPSRTHGVVRVYAEAQTPARRDELLRSASVLVRSGFKTDDPDELDF